MKILFYSLLFLGFFSPLKSQEITLDNLNQYIEYWPSEIRGTKQVKLTNGVTIPQFTRGEILVVTKEGIVVSNQSIRSQGFFKYFTDLDNTDLAETVKQNILANRKNTRILNYLSIRLDKIVNGQRQSFKIPADKEYFLLYFSANWCQPCHQTIELVKKFLAERNASSIQPILISAADKTEAEFESYIQKHTIDWPFVRFAYSGTESPILLNYYMTNNPKGTIPQFVLIDKAGRILSNYRGDEKPFGKITETLLTGNPFIEKQIAGTVHPNARYIDMDACSFFHQGYCFIKKGAKSAVINAKGDFVRNWYDNTSIVQKEQSVFFYSPIYNRNGSYIPYTINTYYQGSNHNSLLVFPNLGVYDDMLIYSDKEGYKMGYMKPSGEKLSPAQYTFATPFINGMAVVANEKGSQLINKKFEVINPDLVKSFNKPVDISVQFDRGMNYYNPEYSTVVLVSELVPVLSSSRKYGYFDKYGKQIISSQFDEASIFSEGLACVGTKDKFGEMYYGFINTRGKYVIEPIFRIKPGDFHCGRAAVLPRNGDGSYRYGYINNKGELVIKVNTIAPSSSSFMDFDRDFASFYGGFAHSILENSVVIDTTGKYYDLRKYPIFFGNGQYVKKGVQQPIIDNKLIFSSGGVRQKYGLMDINGNIILPAIFDTLSSFDPYSGLAYASYSDGKVYYSGFINEKGQFVLLKKEDKATW